MGKKKELNPKELLEKQQEEMRRTRMPKDNQIIGICDRRVGGSRMIVRCMDGKTRICRIPGRFKRRLWVREGDILLIEPWECGGDEKGDVVFKYTRLQVQVLRKRGMLKTLEEVDEF